MSEQDAPSPAQDTPAAAPAPEATPTPAVESPAAPSPAPAVTPETPTPDAPPAESLLGAELSKQTELGLEETKPADAPKEDAPAEAPKEDAPAEDAEPKKDEASQSVEPAPLPTYEPFALPEGFQVDEAQLGEFTKGLGELQNLTKADKKVMQEFGQKLMDKYTANVTETLTRINEYYTNTWEKQKSDWKDAFEKDPEIGGNRRDTTLKSAKQFIRAYGGNEEQQKALHSLLNETGLGNNPAVIRLFSKAGEQLAEGRPLPATKPPVMKQSKVGRRYGGSTGN